MVKAVGSDRVKFAFTIDRAAVVEREGAGPDQGTQGSGGLLPARQLRPAGRGRAEGIRPGVRAIHDAGYLDPIGLGLAPKGDPLGRDRVDPQARRRREGPFDHPLKYGEGR